MYIEIQGCNPDEFSLGISASYQEDINNINYHVITIGLLFFEINFVKVV